jgi:cell division septation protein DedD
LIWSNNRRFLKSPLYIPVIIISILPIWSGCKSSQQTEEAPQPVVPTPPPPFQFEARTDTLKADWPQGADPNADRIADGEIRFMVQIGAFRNPLHASRVQTVARERFKIPVLNDYHTDLKLYQTRIGFFRTYDEANVFRQQMQSEYPMDYQDAWIVQLLRN